MSLKEVINGRNPKCLLIMNSAAESAQTARHTQADTAFM
jgi:hypothetical protein